MAIKIIDKTQLNPTSLQKVRDRLDPPVQTTDSMKRCGWPLEAGCSTLHKPLSLHVSRWDKVPKEELKVYFKSIFKCGGRKEVETWWPIEIWSKVLIRNDY